MHSVETLPSQVKGPASLSIRRLEGEGANDYRVSVNWKGISSGAIRVERAEEKSKQGIMIMSNEDWLRDEKKRIYTALHSPEGDQETFEDKSLKPDHIYYYRLAHKSSDLIIGPAVIWIPTDIEIKGDVRISSLNYQQFHRLFLRKDSTLYLDSPLYRMEGDEIIAEDGAKLRFTDALLKSDEKPPERINPNPQICGPISIDVLKVRGKLRLVGDKGDCKKVDWPNSGWDFEGGSITPGFSLFAEVANDFEFSIEGGIEMSTPKPWNHVCVGNEERPLLWEGNCAPSYRFFSSFLFHKRERQKGRR